MNQNKRENILFLCLLIVICVSGTATYYAFRQDDQRRARMIAETPAQVIEVYTSRGRGQDIYRDRTTDNIRITFRYKVNNESFTRTTTMNKAAGMAFTVAAPAKVCYNPTQLDEAELVEENRKCGV
ncbi:MAG: hypothetical protein MSG64_01195 [Pyrinomonadaceae bacterium MAG19_C2-C3]|nr:hypothetical protein [Pyrinomonadaceae bacterium MAG19_C2-C3]